MAMIRLSVLLLLALPAARALAAPPDAGSKPRVAVLYFEGLTSDVELQNFSKGLASLLISNLVATDKMIVVERERLESVMAELKLGETRSADKGSFAKVGKLLGADYLLVGSLVGAGAQVMITARVVIPETGATVGQAKVRLDPADVFGAEEKVAGIVTEQLVKLGSLAVAPELPKKTHKLSLGTAVKYANALQAKDSKDKVAAKKLLGEVVKEQPDFKLAQLDLLSLRD